MRRLLWIAGIVVVVLFLGVQTHRPNLDPGPVSATAGFEAQLHPDAQVQGVLRKSCYNCHSGEGEIPWYGRVWPVSVLLQNDIRRARARMDLSNWSNLSLEMSHIRLANACRAMRESRMPLWYYESMHPGSSPGRDEVELFCAWAYSSPLQPEVANLR